MPRYENFTPILVHVVPNHFFLLDCGLVAHRTCAATGLPSCLASLDRPLSFEFKSIFGQGLCAQFNPAETPAPAIVRNKFIYLKPSIIIASNFRLYVVVKN